jgi:hypothetical protein
MAVGTVGLLLYKQLLLCIYSKYSTYILLRVNSISLFVSAANLFNINSVAPEPVGSSPHSQQPDNGPYPEPGESTS